MASKPILFNTEMVRAILDGRKTQTRRINKDGSAIVKPNMDLFDPVARTYGLGTYQDGQYQERVCLVEKPVPICPGDVLWVRETFTSEAGRYYYRADFESDFLDPCETLSGGYPASCIGKDCDFCMAQPKRICWRPSIHMPKAAVRLFLRVTAVRVERLQEMKMSDMQAEGVIPATVTGGAWQQWQHDFMKPAWNSTIKKPDLPRYGWDANPWVWVYEFERVKGEKE